MSILDLLDTEAQSESGAWLHLTKPGTTKQRLYLDDDPDKPVRIKTKGPDSETWTSFMRKSAKEKADSADKSSAEVAMEDARILARMTLAWENLPVGDNGEPAPFDRDTAVEVYRKYKDMRMQLIHHILDREAFFTERQDA